MCFARDGGKQITFNLKTLIGVGGKTDFYFASKADSVLPPPPI